MKNIEELKKEFESNFVMDGLGEKQMILLSDDVDGLWNWIEEKLHETKRESIRHGIKMGKNIAKYHDVTPT